MRWYTPAEVAEMLKISEATTWRMLREGKMESTKVGQQYRISQDQLDCFLGSDPKAKVQAQLGQLIDQYESAGMDHREAVIMAADKIKEQAERGDL